MIYPNARALAVASSIAIAAFLCGCSSTSSAGGTTTAPTNVVTPNAHPSSTTASGDASPTEGVCTKPSIQAVLPQGATLEEFQCALGTPYMWAAARAKPGARAFFMQSNNGPWLLVETHQACGSGPAHAPKELAAMCLKE